MAFYAWAQGFMSAINVSVESAKKTPRDLQEKADEHERALRAYCAANPLKNYMDGVMSLYDSLPFYRKISN
jgi:hypothetical protein